eukprot:5187120-Pyramimonas_sp.AAC.1
MRISLIEGPRLTTELSPGTRLATKPMLQYGEFTVHCRLPVEDCAGVGDWRGQWRGDCFATLKGGFRVEALAKVE